MKWFVSTALVAVLCCTPALADAPPRVVNLDFKADVRADGTLANIRPDAALAPMLQEMVSKRVAQWRYRTGTWQGRPVAGKVSQRIAAEVLPVEPGGFALRIREVTDLPDAIFMRGADMDPRMGPPSYPRQALKQRINATLVYAMRRDAQGVPVEVELVGAEIPAHWRARFDAASRQAIQRWRLDPVEIDGQVVDCRLLVPLTFRVSPGRTPPAMPVPILEPYQLRFTDACPLPPVLETTVVGTHL